jgi:hypothetical protein
MDAQGVFVEHMVSLCLRYWLLLVRRTAFLVVVGRQVIYRLALGDEEGMERVLCGLMADTRVTLRLSGSRASMRSGTRA